MDMIDMEFTAEDVYSRLTSLPGSYDVVVSHTVWLDPAKRGQGRGRRAHRLRLNEMEQQGFKYALCTVRSDNRTELRILHGNGWSKLAEFKGECGHNVSLYGKHIRGN